MTERHELNNKHKLNPEPGDAWFERLFTGICVVIGTVGTMVILCKTKKDVGGNQWTWDLDKLEMKSKDDFSAYVSYSSASMKDLTWCDVQPGAHMWVVEQLK